MLLDNFYSGDSIDFMKNNMSDNFVDLVITSPPYDNLRSYKGYTFDVDRMSKELYRVTKKGGIVVWIVGDAVINGGESGTSFKQSLTFINNGFLLHDTMIYEKNTSSFPARKNGNRYTQIFEYMFIFSKGKPKTANLICDKENKWAGFTNWGKNTCRSKDNDLKETSKIKEVPRFSPRNNIWKYNVGGGFATQDKIAYKHPAIFPDKLAQDHILSWSNEGDIVLDPMCGSGTTCKMTWLNNRKFIGIDMSEDYINNICIPRLHQYGWEEGNSIGNQS